MELKQWRCKNGHVLGAIQLNGNEVVRLMLYRHAVDLAADVPAEVDVVGPVLGTMPVVCDAEHCGDVKLWDMSLDALAYLIRELRPDELEQLQVRVMRGRVRKVNKHKNRATV